MSEVVLENELELPQGWVESTLEELIIFKIGGDWGSPPSKKIPSDSVEVNVIRSTELKNWNIEKGKSAVSRIIKKSSLEKRELKNGDMLLEVSGGSTTFPVGRTIMIDNSIIKFFKNHLICTNFFRKMVFSDLLNIKYIKYFFDYLYTSGITWKYKKQTTNIQNLNVNEYLSSLILIPPLHEQKRIVSKIEEIFSRIDSAKLSLEHTKLQLEQYRSSLLKSAFEGKLTKNNDSKNLMKLETFPLGELIDEIIDHRGVTPKKLGGDWVEEGIPVISAKNIKNYRLTKREKIRFITKKMGQKWMPRDVQFGDILMTSEGATLGELALLKENTKFCLGQRLFGIRTNNKILDSTFLYYFLISPKGKQEIFGHATGTTVGGLRQTELMKIMIILPKIENQKNIVMQIEQGFSLIENTTQIVESSLQKLQIMKISILKQAFEGKLVPQDPNDESAEILLEKIKHEKEQLIQKQKVSKVKKNVK